MDRSTLKQTLSKWILPVALGLLAHRWEGAWIQKKLRTELSWNARTWEGVIATYGLHPHPKNPGPLTSSALEDTALWYWPATRRLQIGAWTYQASSGNQRAAPSHPPEILGEGIGGLLRWIEQVEQERGAPPPKRSHSSNPRIWY